MGAKKKYIFGGALSVVVLVALFVGVLEYKHQSRNPAALPVSITNGINSFAVYQPAKSTAKDLSLSLVSSSVKYTQGVLVYELLLPSNKKIAVSQQKTPEGFDASSLQADKEFTTRYGKAYITDGQSRTTAALFTNDGTWLLLNAPSPIGADSMQVIVSALRPTKK